MDKKISRAIAIYSKGESFCYYRGVGHVFYSEEPGILRGERLREEDRWYRGMKTGFYDELDKLHYSDRLAMLQHYELPTRVLDVTFNPLVGLYMAVNTIYIPSDKKQKDYGEVIVYFDKYTDGEAYDSNSVLVLAALAKLKYEDKMLLRGVIEELSKGIEERVKNRAEKGDDDNVERNVTREKIRTLVNFCVHLRADNSNHKYVFNDNEKKEADDVLEGNFKCPFEIFAKVMSINNKVVAEEKYRAFAKAYIKLLGTVRRENPAFTNCIDIFILMKAYHVRVGMTNDRIRAQAGSFIICGLDKNYINTSMKSGRSELIRRMFVRTRRWCIVS